jgi:hypothetical protein
MPHWREIGELVAGMPGIAGQRFVVGGGFGIGVRRLAGKVQGMERAMYARLIQGQAKPERIAEAEAFFRDEVAPAVREDQGSAQVSFLLDRETGKFVAVSFYQSADDIVVSTARFRSRTAKAAELLTAPPTAEVFEVIAHRRMTSVCCQDARSGDGFFAALRMRLLRNRVDGAGPPA